MSNVNFNEMEEVRASAAKERVYHMTGLTNFEIRIPTSIQTRARGGAQPTIAPKRGTEELRASAVKERVYHDWTHSLRDMHPNIDVDRVAKRIMRDEWLITRAQLESA